MEKANGGGGKLATRFGFNFSWADEVEREEKEQQQQLAREQGREAKKEQQQTGANPFGSARPREVVLEEKGVDWRARDRGLDAISAALAPAAEVAALSRAHTVPAPACARMSAPARRTPWDYGSGRTPGPRRHDTESTQPVSRSAWGGSKRKCAGEVPGPATAQRVRAVDGQGKKVFGELNVGEVLGSSFRRAAKKSCNSGGAEIEGRKASETAVADGGGSRGCRATATAATATEDQSAVGQKRKGRNRGRRAGSAENQQALLL